MFSYFDYFFKSNIEKIFNFFVGSYNLFSVKNEEKNIEKCFIFLPLVSVSIWGFLRGCTPKTIKHYEVGALMG